MMGQYSGFERPMIILALYPQLEKLANGAIDDEKGQNFDNLHVRSGKMPAKSLN